MKEFRRNMRALGVLLLCAFLVMGCWFGYAAYTQGARWMTTAMNNRLTAAKSDSLPGDILDRTGEVLAATNAEGKRVYAEDETLRRALSQTVGDPMSMSGTGAETYFAGALYGFSGSIIDYAWQFFNGEARKGDTLTLTVDAHLTRRLSEAFPSGYRGTLVLINYKTGEILAMVSKPDYDPNSVLDGDASAEDGAFLNRCLQGRYTPGSVFKIVTAAAALTHLTGVQGRAFACEGERAFGDGTVKCISGTVHGSLTLEQAFAKSCNVTFAALAYEMGAAALTETAERMGFNRDFSLAETVLYESSFPTDLADVNDLAWAGVGQSRVLVTPLHMAMIAGAVANGGEMLEPKLILKQTGATGLARLRASTGSMGKILSEDAADTLAAFMRASVTDGTSKAAAVDGVTICGKTGSAETSDDKSKPTDAWFVGFAADEKYPYAVAVVIEEGGSGGDKAAKLAKIAFQTAIYGE